MSPHTWGSGTDRASPGGEGTATRPPFCCSASGHRPSGVQAEAPTHVGILHWSSFAVGERLHAISSVAPHPAHRPSRVEAEAPTRVGLLLGPGLTRRGERRAPPHPSRARARFRQEVNLPRTRRGGGRSTVPDTFSDPTPTSLAVAGMLQRRVCTFALTTDVALRNAGGERSLNQ